MFNGKKIRDKRLNLGISADQLAKELGCGIKAINIYKWEKGHRPHKIDQRKKITEWLAKDIINDQPIITNGIVKEDPVPSDYKEKFYSLLEKYNELLESIIKKQ